MSEGVGFIQDHFYKKYLKKNIYDISLLAENYNTGHYE